MWLDKKPYDGRASMALQDLLQAVSRIQRQAGEKLFQVLAISL
jgi:hypothetical protein